MMNDYSQHMEQEHILDFFKGETGWFLDIGANDGITGSNSRALAELGWGGVLVEANPRIFQRLLHNCAGNSKLTCVNVPVKDTCGLVTFFDLHWDQCSTCDLKHQPKDAIKATYWLNSTCPGKMALTLGGNYEFVSLDIEGTDLEVLEVMGPVLGKTKLLCIEDAIPCSEFDQDYYDQMLAAASRHGLSRVVARTNNGKGNTLLARAV